MSRGAAFFFIEIRLTKFPASLGTTVLRFTKSWRPFSFAGAFFAPRLKSVGPITRSATDPDGNYSVQTFSFSLDDRDAELRPLFDEGQPTEYMINREVTAWTISEAAILAGATPATSTPVFRGFVSGYAPNGYDLDVSCVDALGSLMSGFNLGKRVLNLTIKDLVTSPLVVCDATKDLPLILLAGEHSDYGAMTTPTSAATSPVPASIGAVPAREVCEIDITSLTGVPPTTVIPPPVITIGDVVTGASGEEVVYYGATLVTPLGESGMSNIVAVNGAANRDIGNYTRIEGTAVYGVDNNVRVWTGPSPDNMNAWLDFCNGFSPDGSWGYFDGASNWPGPPYRTENDIPKYMDPPAGTAQGNPNVFSVMFLCRGRRYDQLRHYASDLADGVEPRRALVPDADYGTALIRPTDPQWPFPNPWITMNSIDFIGYLWRGPRLEHHRTGTISGAADVCGPHDMDGKLVNQAWPALQFILNEYGLRNGGSGNRNQEYGTLATFSNGDPIIETSSITACQDTSKEWLQDETGYVGNIAVIDPNETWREFWRKHCVSFGGRGCSNRFGQFRAFVINTLDAGPLGRHFRQRIEIKAQEGERWGHDEVTNRILLSYFYHIDAGEFRARELPIDNDVSMAAHVPGGVVGVVDPRGVRDRPLEAYHTNDRITAIDVANQELQRRDRRPRYVPFSVPLLGLDYDLGEQCRLTSNKGIVDSETPCVILEHVLDYDNNEVRLVVQDRQAIIAQTSAMVGDDADDTSREVGDDADGSSHQVG